MESKPDYKKLAADFAKDFQQNWKKDEEVPATLFLDGHLFATGTAAVSGDHLKFRPKQPKQLDNVLHEIIGLKVGQNEKVYFLKHSRYLLDMSSDSCWCFSYTEKDDL